MRKLFICANFFVLLILFSGCSSKEFQTNNYFDRWTKDEVLEAGKLAFLNDSKTDYIIDSYRDRIEVTKIGIVFGILKHKDFILNVEENECGTNATLEIKRNFGIEKSLDVNALNIEHLLFWHNLKSILEDKLDDIKENIKLAETKEPSEILSDDAKEVMQEEGSPYKKDLSNCVIKSEFEHGMIKNEESSIGDINDENL